MLWLLVTLVLTVIAETEQCSSLLYKVGSTDTTGYLLRIPGSGTITTSSRKVTTSLGPRFYMTQTCTTTFPGAKFSAFKLLGGSIAFDVDVSQLGCGTNAAFYLVDMPHANPGGANDYYCDANCVGGNCCTEMDLLEANRHAIQITPHRCTASTSGCDGGGCALNTQSISNGFGPGTQYTINSLLTFTVKISFAGTSTSLTGITSVISQGSKSITLSHTGCASGYLSSMNSFFAKGLVPVWSYWSGDMSWLDRPACSSESPEVQGPWSFNNLVVTGSVVTATGPAAPPTTPVPTGSQTCSTVGTTTNQNWVEFQAPKGQSADWNTVSATVKCSTGACDPCKWFGAGSKYQCNCPGQGCTSPVATVGGKTCYFVNAAVSDASTTTNQSESNIAVITLGVCLAVTLLLLAIFIGLLIRAKKINVMETA